MRSAEWGGLQVAGMRTCHLAACHFPLLLTKVFQFVIVDR
jgi:hypothetical protein